APDPHAASLAANASSLLASNTTATTTTTSSSLSASSSSSAAAASRGKAAFLITETRPVALDSIASDASSEAAASSVITDEDVAYFQRTFSLPQERLITYFYCALHRGLNRFGWLYISSN